ncbi:acyl-CoA dehydrogenase family protein, partial [Brevundimonas sp.]|uniref:acyl-CoA dehydrogenase family protein n=1 Tax=Brevundimonas sp. TaxID=1871086 RepID=UPI003D6D43B6
GLAEPDFVLIAEAAGYVALPEGLAEHAGVAVPLLASAAPAHPLLEAAASGEIILAVGHAVNPFVAHADAAGALLLNHEGEIHLVEREAATLTREASIDPFRRLFRIDWTPSDATRLATAETGAPLWDAALDRGALFSAAQCLGLAQRSIHLAVDYARERQQFGKPIGGYQAVKHLIATAQVAVEFARPVVHAAAADLHRGSLQSQARVSHAKIVAAEAADLAARTSIQVHGAMGYSWEVDVHLFLKRALALTYAWGAPALHRARVEARVFGRPVGADQTFSHEAA